MAGEGSACETRFMYINSLVYGNITSNSGNLAGFPAANVITQNRGELWVTGGNFKIDATNNKLYLCNDSVTPITITLTSASYTGTTLAAHIDSLLSSYNIDVTYTVDYKFRFRKTAGTYFILLLSAQTNSIWNDIGFVGVVDITTNTAINLDSLIRIHTHEYIDFDLGYAMDISFFGLMPQRNYANMLTAGATINVKASNINDASSAPLDINVPSAAEGCFYFLEQGVPVSYRYVWLTIIDPENPYGPNLVFSQLFMGGYIALPNKTVDNGFTVQEVDRALRTESQAGGLYFERYGRHKRISGLRYSNMSKAETGALQQLYYDIGKSQNFYLSLDSGNFDNDIDQFTYFGVFENDPILTKQKASYFDANFEFRSN